MEMVQISMFDEPEVVTDQQAELFEILKRGSGFEGGCLRIYAAEQLLDAGRFAEFLADEFSVGGHSVRGGFVDYSSKGLTIRRWKNQEKDFPWKYDTSYSWRQVANAYHMMVRKGIFPEPEVVRMFMEARKAGKGAPAPRIHWYG